MVTLTVGEDSNLTKEMENYLLSYFVYCVQLNLNVEWPFDGLGQK